MQFPRFVQSGLNLEQQTYIVQPKLSAWEDRAKNSENEQVNGQA
jgi:hypothetical protein